MSVKHGGNLIEVAAQYGSPISEWLDLSTGVSPYTYPVGDIPESVWNRLPQPNDGLELAAKHYYDATKEPIAVAGSQAAIQLLPAIATEQLDRACGVVALPRIGYKEHQKAWQGFELNQTRWSLVYYEDVPTPEQIEASDVVLIINPNNPTGKRLSRDYLQTLHQNLAGRGGLLIVDEAFADIPQQESMLTPHISLEGLVVLRSVGKFFGLAGARVGFVFSTEHLKQRLESYLGPWTVTGPSRWVVSKALSDTKWQESTTVRIKHASMRLNDLLKRTLGFSSAGTELFTTVYTERAVEYHHLLCENQIYTRLCDEKNAIRFGLPANETQWQKLEEGLNRVQQQDQIV